MNDNRNLIIAFVLSALVLLGWNWFVARPQMQAERARQIYVHKENTQTAARPASTDLRLILEIMALLRAGPRRVQRP